MKIKDIRAVCKCIEYYKECEVDIERVKIGMATTMQYDYLPALKVNREWYVVDHYKKQILSTEFNKLDGDISYLEFYEKIEIWE